LSEGVDAVVALSIGATAKETFTQLCAQTAEPPNCANAAPARRILATKGTPLVPQHDVAVTEVAEQHRIEEEIQPHRSLQNRQTVEWMPGNRQDMTIEILRGIRIEFQRSLVCF
jgi:LAS superfamily LD-carboxypeptidase LdcB